MNVFVFAPNNEFKAKFKVPDLSSVERYFSVYQANNSVDVYDYIECEGEIWTVIHGANGLELSKGRINPKPESSNSSKSKAIPITTFSSLPGHVVQRTCGVVFGEAIMGANFLRDLGASLTDVFGGRSGAYETKLREGRAIAIREMMEEATEVGGNAVIGVRVDYETVGGSMLMVCASGTAICADSTGQEVVGRPGEEEPNCI